MRYFVWIIVAACAVSAQESPPDSQARVTFLADIAGVIDSVHASPLEPEPAYSSGFRPDAPSGDAGTYGTETAKPGRVFFDMRMATPFDDFQMGGRVGFFAGTRVLTDFFLDFEMRPYRRAVRIRESETLEYQFREERFTFGPGVQTRLPLGGLDAALVIGAGAGLSPAWYRGSNREAPSAGLGWLETGLRFWSAPSGADWGFSYQFFPLPGVSPHRVAFHLGYRLSAP